MYLLLYCLLIKMSLFKYCIAFLLLIINNNNIVHFFGVFCFLLCSNKYIPIMQFCDLHNKL